jgi:ABC-type phosphate transport system substrate-binding protein
LGALGLTKEGHVRIFPAAGALAVTLASSLASPPVGSSAEDFIVVISEANPTRSLSRDALSRIYLKKETRWPDETEAEPVDQTRRSPVRLAFTRAVLGFQQPSAVESYWQQQAFSGRATPPVVKASDAEVMAYVATRPGAVGYVSAGTTLLAVRALTVVE